MVEIQREDFPAGLKGASKIDMHINRTQTPEEITRLSLGIKPNGLMVFLLSEKPKGSFLKEITGSVMEVQPEASIRFTTVTDPETNQWFLTATVNTGGSILPSDTSIFPLIRLAQKP